MGELPHLKSLVERHKSDPIAVLGIDTDGDKDAFRKGCAEKGVVWPNIFEGSTSGKIPTQFGVRGYPTIYVLDAKGVIRFKNTRGDALTQAVETLLAEMKAGDKR